MYRLDYIMKSDGEHRILIIQVSVAGFETHEASGILKPSRLQNSSCET